MKSLSKDKKICLLTFFIFKQDKISFSSADGNQKAQIFHCV